MTHVVRVAVVFHSGYGHTRKQAEAVHAGAGSVMGVQSTLVPVEDVDAHWDHLDHADAIIFGAPTYMGSASAPFKAFMDASAQTVFARGAWKDKVAAGFTNAASRSGDKLNTLQQLAIFAAQQGMHWVNLGLPPGHNNSTSNEDSMNRHGYFLGAAAQSDADVNADQGATAADLKTSAYLGARVARVALQLAAGRSELAKTVLTV
ncbi:flavodoxin family protein [Cupriavidus pauculus]|uniref:flavodoxin family protein n=1 Tax=Cupriavidus pauculus TaxID=82633 RepID=UPI001EE352A9|nr:flavodoxin family protein [Cupriavidus pauculus]GJG93796.1 flavodoxin family protein [Cupriavidus pauculus]